MFSNSLVCDILEYLNKNINEEITIDELANRFYFDKTYIMKRFKKEIGKSIHDYINTIRIMNSLDYYKYDNYISSIKSKYNLYFFQFSAFITFIFNFKFEIIHEFLIRLFIFDFILIVFFFSN